MQMIEVARHKLEALAKGIESCVSLCRDSKDSKLSGQRPDEMLMDMANSVKAWIKDSSENKAQSKE